MAAKEKTTPKSEQISASRIIQTVDRWRTTLWPLWIREKQISAFYNGGQIPLDVEEADDGAPVSVGLGYRYIKKPFEALLDSVLQKPGFIQTQLDFPREPKRKSVIERAVDKEINGVLHKRCESLLRALAGRAVVTGRAYAYRLSRWDWKFQQGRILHDGRDGDDVYDSSFREWAWMGDMTLRELDEKIDSSRDVGTGWNRQAMRELKKWILRTTSHEKNLNETWLDEQVLRPFNESLAIQPLNVYWYFRKNGLYNDLTGKEKIDLYCVSRNSSLSTIQVVTDEEDGTVSKYLDIDTDDEHDRIMYYVKNAFDGIDECLIPLLLDSRVDGDQKLAQIEGTGQIMVARLLPMEQLAISLIEGTCWAVQPNWTSATAMDEAKLKALARNGVGPWDYVPSGITALAKNNSISGMNGAMDMLRMLGISADQDAATGEISPMSQTHPELKSVGDQLISQIGAAASRRSSKFFGSIDLLADEITRTVCRPISLWQKSDAGYPEVRHIQGKLLLQHQIAPDEYNSAIISGKCRRLAMDGERSQVATKSAAFMQTFGGQVSAEGHHFIAKEAARATWDDATAELLLPDEPPVDVTQQVMILGQESMCLVSLRPAQRNPSDNPMLHIMAHMQTLGARIQVAQQAGSWTPQDRQGVSLLMQHAAQDVPGLPQQAAKQVGQALQQMARVVASLKVSGDTTETQLKQADAQRKMQETQMKIGREVNLQHDREAKIALDQQSLTLKMHDQNQKDKNSAAQRASMLSQAAATLPELPEPSTDPVPLAVQGA